MEELVPIRDYVFMIELPELPGLILDFLKLVKVLHLQAFEDQLLFLGLLSLLFVGWLCFSV